MFCEQRVSGEKLPEPASLRSAGRSRHDSNVRHPASKAGVLVRVEDPNEGSSEFTLTVLCPD
ncbi:hypothetical protein BBD46_02730 [Natrialba sp. SSL1]|nr:hypothetical protein BBD46_02730 [Natrialba sp. SSL1]